VTGHENVAKNPVVSIFALRFRRARPRSAPGAPAADDFGAEVSSDGEMAPAVSLRDVITNDIAVFFVQEQDPAAREVAAFTNKRPTDRPAYEARWARLLKDETVNVKTVLFGDDVIGYVAAFERSVGQREVAYWIGREFWGRNLATQALTLFLKQFTERPLYARCAIDHAASMRVLEKCGFVTYGRERLFAEGRATEVDEWIFELK
jgi:RimJ/RimL family protein N-acetyltransferase